MIRVFGDIFRFSNNGHPQSIPVYGASGSISQFYGRVGILCESQHFASSLLRI